MKFKFTKCVQIRVVGSIPGAWLCGVSMFCFCLSGWVLQVLRLFMHASYACKPSSLISMWLLHLFSTRWRSHISTQLQRSAVFRRAGGGMLGSVRSLRFALGLLLLVAESKICCLSFSSQKSKIFHTLAIKHGRLQDDRTFVFEFLFNFE